MTTEDLIKLADKFAFFIPGSEEGEKARKTLLDALEAQGREVARLTVERDVNKRMRDQHFAELAAIRAQESVIDFTVLHQFAAAQAISYNKLCTAVRMAVASSVPTQDVGALVEVIQEAADRLEGIKGGSVSETIAMMRAAITQSQAARVPDASPAAKDTGLVADTLYQEILEALENLMAWQVKNVKVWNHQTWDNAQAVIDRHNALSKLGGV